MEYNCQNCDQVIQENFCSNCGQKKYKRIDRKYIWDEVQYSILHTNKGFLYSVKKLLKNPGKTAREYIDGNRVNHYKPILLTFVLSGITAFFSYKILDLNGMMREMFFQKGANSDFMVEILSFFSGYYSIIMLLLLPVFAVITKMIFRKWGQNYYEHIVMNAYILSYYSLLSIFIFYPLLYLFKSNFELTSTIITLSTFSFLFVLTWFYIGFYKEKSKKAILLKILWMLLLLFIGYILLIIGSVALYFVLEGPAGIPRMRAKD